MSRSKKVNLNKMASNYSHTAQDWQAGGKLLKEDKEHLIRHMKEQKVTIISLPSGEVFELVPSEKLVHHKVTGRH